MRFSRWLLLCFLFLLGCPKKAERDPIDEHPDMAKPTATPDDERPSGNWTVHVVSDSPGLNPDSVDTPEARAKMFFDHHAHIDAGTLIVDQKTLKKTFTGKADLARELDWLITNTNWDTVRSTTEGETEGGTVFTFTIAASDGPIEIRTSNLDAHPELRRIVEILKETAGMP